MSLMIAFAIETINGRSRGSTSHAAVVEGRISREPFPACRPAPLTTHLRLELCGDRCPRQGCDYQDVRSGQPMALLEDLVGPELLSTENTGLHDGVAGVSYRRGD
jgi:hypothetical protein